MHKDIKEILYTEEEIKAKCDELAKQIDQDYAGQEILLVGLLKGSVPFMAELAKHLKSDVKFDFMSVSSYSGVESKTLVVRQDIKEDIRGKNVLIVEDILDTGKTLYNVKEMLEKRHFRSFVHFHNACSGIFPHTARSSEWKTIGNMYFFPDLLCTFSSSDIPDLPLTFTCLDPSCSSSFCNPDY